MSKRRRTAVLAAAATSGNFKIDFDTIISNIYVRKNNVSLFAAVPVIRRTVRRILSMPGRDMWRQLSQKRDLVTKTL